MADQTLLDFLSGPVLTELAKSPTIIPGVPRVLPDVFYNPSGTPQPVGGQAKYMTYNGDRSTPPVLAYNSPSATRETTGANWQYVEAIGSKINFVVGGDLLYAMMSTQPYVSANARFEFTRRYEAFKTQMDTLRTTAVHSMLLTGAIYAGTQVVGTGVNASVGNNIQTSSTSANVSILAGAGSTGTTGARTFAYTSTWTNGGTTTVGDWSSAATDIPKSLRAMKSGYIKTSNYMPAIILYGKNIPSYFASNTSMQAYMSRNQEIGREFQRTNEMPKGMLDFDWVPAYNAYFVDGASTINTWLGDDSIVIIPRPDPSWYEFMESGTLIPTGISAMSGDIESFLSQTKPAYGRFSYCTVQSMDPICYKAILGDYFAPIVKQGLVQWIATVK